MDNTNNIDLDREMAYFRFSLIAPVIQGTLSDASAAAYFRRVTEEPIRRPDGILFQYQHTTLQKWYNLYKEGGMDALMPKERSDKGSIRALSEDCIKEIYLLREKFPRLDAVQIHLRLVHEGFIPATVSSRTIQRFIKSKGLKPGATSGPLKDRKAYEKSSFGDMWVADTCYFPYVKDEHGKKRRTYLIALLDDHSRMIVGAKLFFDDNSYNFQKILKEAISTYQIPTILYCDHGSPYENAQLKYICGDIGIVLTFAPVKDGAAKGKIERAFGVLKGRWLNGLDMSEISSLTDFNHSLAEAVRKHNLSVNSSTSQTPIDRFLATRDSTRIPRSQEWLDERFTNRAARKVKGDSTLSINNVQYDAPMQFIRQTVEVRFLPDQMEKAFILDSGNHYPLKRTDKEANSRVKRDKGFRVDYSKGGSDNV